MTTDIERKLIEAIWGNGYGEGLPDIVQDYEWVSCDKKNADIAKMNHDTYAYDIAGNLWVLVYIGFAYD